MTCKIKLLSDFHLEFYSPSQQINLISQIDNTDIDVLVLAGDICTWKEMETLIPMFCDRFPEVLYVLGNHEYYGSNFSDTNAIANNIDVYHENFHFLENDIVEINGQRFLGCTLWFKKGDESDYMSNFINDFRMIKDCNPIAYQNNTQSQIFLEQNVKADDVVITHHLPLWECVSKEFELSPMNIFFANDMYSIIENNRPKLWLHGHSHDYRKDKVLDTEIYRNPFGYPGQESGHRSDLIIEV